MLDDHLLAPATVLRGHVSEDTAYVVDDYPYGFTLRCRIRYWLHTAGRGPARGQVRFMSQTTNPKRDGHPWNKPKAGQYHLWAVIILDARGHVGHWPVSGFGVDPWRHLAMRLRTVYRQLTDNERRGYDALLRASLVHDQEGWAKAGRAHALIAEGVTRDALLADHGLYLNERDYEIGAAAHAAGLGF
jgi:hypothetical protein